MVRFCKLSNGCAQTIASINDERLNTSNLHTDSESDEDGTRDEPDFESDTESSLDDSDDDDVQVLDQQHIAIRLAQLEMEDSRPFDGETSSEDLQPQETMSRIENIQFTQQLIQEISNATLES